ncbi:unnamed protein product, partial [Choristocarpus tenellus]
KLEIDFDQYLEVVCFFCMFSRHEVLRFIFGALDPKMQKFIDEDTFKGLIDIVTKHESGVPGNFRTKAIQGFRKMARNGTQLEFPQFEELCSKYPRIP